LTVGLPKKRNVFLCYGIFKRCHFDPEFFIKTEMTLVEKFNSAFGSTNKSPRKKAGNVFLPVV